MSNLSDDPRDKLQAVLNHDRPDPDDDLDVACRDACGQRFSRLTQGERWPLATVRAAYERGSEADAEQLAAAEGRIARIRQQIAELQNIGRLARPLSDD